MELSSGRKCYRGDSRRSDDEQSPLLGPLIRTDQCAGERHFVHDVRVPMEIPESHRRELWNAATASGTRLVLCGHVHRTRLAWHDGIAVGLNGQSGADWAGRTIAYYDLSRTPLEQIQE